MPLYTVSSKTKLPDTTKAKLAKKIMDVHCGLTGAPETFVNVIFSQNVPLRPGILHNVLCSVRKGRTPDMNDTLLQSMHTNIADLLSVSESTMELNLFEVPAQWIMEGGEILPEPGEEDDCEWLKEANHG